MSGDPSSVTSWMLDSSTFIHALIIDKLALVVSVRSPVFFSEYVFRFELGANAKERTRLAAVQVVERKQIGIRQLTLTDLDRLSQLKAPRRIGLGELACAVIAERTSAGVLCDDWRAKGWIEARISAAPWDSIEGVLLEAALRGFVGEFDLAEFQRTLETNLYICRCDLRLEHLGRILRRKTT